MSVSAAYPINPPSAHVIRDDAEAIRIAHEIAALLLIEFR